MVASEERYVVYGMWYVGKTFNIEFSATTASKPTYYIPKTTY